MEKKWKLYGFINFQKLAFEEDVKYSETCKSLEPVSFHNENLPSANRL